MLGREDEGLYVEEDDRCSNNMQINEGSRRGDEM